MQRMLPAAGAILVEFHPVWIVAAVFLRHVIAFFTVFARQDDYRADIFSLRSHSCYLTFDLLDDFCNDTRADGQAAFTDGEFGALFEPYRDDERHRQVDIVTWQHHLHTLR